MCLGHCFTHVCDICSVKEILFRQPLNKSFPLSFLFLTITSFKDGAVIFSMSLQWPEMTVS